MVVQYLYHITIFTFPLYFQVQRLLERLENYKAELSHRLTESNGQLPDISLSNSTSAADRSYSSLLAPPPLWARLAGILFGEDPLWIARFSPRKSRISCAIIDLIRRVLSSAYYSIPVMYEHSTPEFMGNFEVSLFYFFIK